MTEVSARQALSDAIRYWEPRRILYNAVLLAVVGALFYVHLPSSRLKIDLNLILVLFVLAVLANVAYCACYVVDVSAQVSSFRAHWLRIRVVLLLVGIAFAGTLTYFFASGFFAA